MRNDSVIITKKIVSMGTPDRTLTVIVSNSHIHSFHNSTDTGTLIVMSSLNV